MSDSILPLELVDLDYSVRGRPLLRGVTATLAAGSRSVILGPNGAGKSLTLRLAHGLLRPTSGTVAWRGPARARASLRQAMVFERPVLLRRSCAKNVEYALAVRRVPRPERRRRVERVLAETGLSQLARQPARALSAGEQQRLALARVWVLEPEVLFLDEPTAALDPAAAQAIETLILELAAAGTKIVMTTHDLAQARRMAEEVLFLHRGSLVECAPAARFFAKPESDEARAFLAGELLP